MTKSTKDRLADQKFDREDRKRSHRIFATGVNIDRLSQRIARSERQACEDQRREKQRALVGDMHKEKGLVLERLASCSCSYRFSAQDKDKWRDDIEKIDVTDPGAAQALKRLRDRVEYRRRDVAGLPMFDISGVWSAAGLSTRPTLRNIDFSSLGEKTRKRLEKAAQCETILETERLILETGLGMVVWHLDLLIGLHAGYTGS